MLYITDILVDKLLSMESGSYIADYGEAEKRTLLEYLQKFDASMFTSEPVVDAFSNEVVAEADNGYTDGTYRWYKSEVYYFEKYNLRLNADFVDYVMNKSTV